MESVEERLAAVESRNARVEGDKGWETSWVRRGLVAVVTYVCAVILLNMMGNDAAYKNALVPVMGYLLSTLSLGWAKTIWLSRKKA